MIDPDTIWAVVMGIIALPTGQAFGALDVVALLLLGAFAIDGGRSGMIRGGLDLIIVLAAVIAGLAALRPAGALLASLLPIRPAVAELIAFGLALAIITGLGVVVTATLAAEGRRLTHRAGSLKRLDAVLGVPVGVLRGGVILALLAATMSTLPLTPEVAHHIAAAPTLARIAPLGTALAPDLAAALGRLALDGTVDIPPPLGPFAQVPAAIIPTTGRALRDPGGERELIVAINRERRIGGLPPLSVDPGLSDTARAHSEDMVARRFLSHQSPTAGSPRARLDGAGVSFRIAAENVAHGQAVEAIHRMLLNSADHRRAILGAQYRRLGVGVVAADGWGIVVTQLFAD